MKKLFQIGICLFIVLIAMNPAQAQKKQLGIHGKKAPAWTFDQWIDKNGKETTVKLEDYKDKVVYLMFFQSWCPGCHSQGFPTLKYVRNKYKDNKDIAFLAVQTVFEGKRTNSFKKLRKTQKEYDLAIPFGHDDGSNTSHNYPELMEKYLSGGTPWVVIIDKEGVVRFNDFNIQPREANQLLKELLSKGATP